MFKKPVIITAVVLAAIILIAAIFTLMRKETVEYGISQYEKGNYARAIKVLNRFASTSNYDEGEKIYYYRCKSLYGLADELEEDYEDELVSASVDNRGKPEYEKNRIKIETKLAELNRKTGADLIFIPAPRRSRIGSKGLFYNEFTSRYRGSQFIEDLDFYQSKKSIQSDRARSFEHMVTFLKKYPVSNYAPQIISMLFDAIRDGNPGMERFQDDLKKIILDYVSRFPTSQEISRLYTSSGDSVNLRNAPGLTAAPSGKTVKDEMLIQFEKSMDMMQVGDTRDYWYRVSTLRGVRGWIFGKFLKPAVIETRAATGQTDVWSVEDRFASWVNSNTPENWSHIKNADQGAVSFRKTASGNILLFNSKGSGQTGLISRYNTTRSFRLQVRARFISGSPVILAAFAISRNDVFYLRVDSGKIEVNERSIPVNTSDWHDYEISSDDGRYASLSVDNQMISIRIPPVTENLIGDRGVYLTRQGAGQTTSCEVELVRLK